jgi:hypothetical protein
MISSHFHVDNFTPNATAFSSSSVLKGFYNRMTAEGSIEVRNLSKSDKSPLPSADQRPISRQPTGKLQRIEDPSQTLLAASGTCSNL